MSNSQFTVAQVDAYLSEFLSGDNEKIKITTTFFKKFSKMPESISIFSQIIGQSTNPNNRHLASVLLKRSMATLFPKTDPRVQTQLKEFLLSQFFKEQVSVVRKSLGSIIGTIAQITLHEQNWNELYQILELNTNPSQTVDARRNGLILLGTILDYSGGNGKLFNQSDSLKKHYSQFYGFFKASISDADKTIRIETVKCLISLFDNIGYMDKEQIKKYQEFIQPILQIIHQCLQEGDEDPVHYCLDAFSYLADCKITILDLYLGDIVVYLTKFVLPEKKISKNILDCVFELLYSICLYHKNVFNKNAVMLKDAIEQLCLIISRPISRDQLEEDEDTVQDSAMQLLGSFCCLLSRKKVYTILLEAVSVLVQSGEQNRMNSGFLILAQMSEGCFELIARNLQNPIMNIFIPLGLNSQFPEVKGACIKCLSYFAEYLPDEILKYHAVIIPAILNSFNDLSVKVAEKSLFALDIFCDKMEDELNFYLDTIIPKLCQISVAPQANALMRRVAVSCIASCISSAELKFAPYLADTSKLIQSFIFIPDQPETLEIKGEAISALGKIAYSFIPKHPETYDRLILPCMEMIYNLLQNSQDYFLKENCLSFFYNLASVLGPRFAEIFPKLITITLKIARSEEGVTYEKDKKGEFSLDTDSEDEEMGHDDMNTAIKVKSTFLDEKSAAIHALGEFAVACPSLFVPHFEEAFAILESCYSYFDENVRLQTSQCYKDIVIAMVKYTNNNQLPAYTNGLPCLQRLAKDVEEKISQDILHKLFYLIEQDESVDVASQTLLYLEELCKKLGPAFIDFQVDNLCTLIIKCLEKKIVCLSQIDSDEEAEEDDEDQDSNSYIVEAIMDLVPRLAKILQQGFEPNFRRIFPSLMSLTGAKRDINDQIQILGCFAVCIKKAPFLVHLMADIIIPVIVKLVKEQEDDEINRNAAFCLGLLAQYGTTNAAVIGSINQILITLKTIFESSKDPAAKDNAASAFCRIINANRTLLPFQEVFSHVIAHAPFKGDELEARTLINTILFLAQNEPEFLKTHMQKSVSLMVDGLKCLTSFKIKTQQKDLICALLKNLGNQDEYRALVQNSVLSIQEEGARNQVMALLS